MCEYCVAEARVPNRTRQFWKLVGRYNIPGRCRDAYIWIYKWGPFHFHVEEVVIERDNFWPTPQQTSPRPEGQP